MSVQFSADNHPAVIMYDAYYVEALDAVLGEDPVSFADDIVRDVRELCVNRREFPGNPCGFRINTDVEGKHKAGCTLCHQPDDRQAVEDAVTSMRSVEATHREAKSLARVQQEATAADAAYTTALQSLPTVLSIRGLAHARRRSLEAAKPNPRYL